VVVVRGVVVESCPGDQVVLEGGGLYRGSRVPVVPYTDLVPVIH
jgi:hypothetical protein